MKTDSTGGIKGQEIGKALAHRTFSYVISPLLVGINHQNFFFFFSRDNLSGTNTSERSTKMASTITINTADYVLESAVKDAPLTFNDKKKQARFELGVCMAVYGWDNLQTAVEAQWGGADSADKRDWLVGNVVEMFDESYLECEDIEDRLVGVMEDEFGTVLEDDSALPVAAQVISIWRECDKGDFSTVDALYKLYQEKEEKRKAGLIKPTKVEVTGGESDSEYSDVEDDDETPAPAGDIEMEEAEPQGPVVDDDGFELVQKKGKNKKR